MKNEVLNANTLTNKQKKTILITIMMGSFLTALSQTVLTSALPSIMRDFHVNANTGQWLTTVYMLVLGIMIPATPYLINRFSTRKLFISSMIFFFLGCLLSITAKNFGMMICSRILQGICSGMVMQLVQILMMRMYSVKERGSAMGLYGFIIGVAPAIGPTLSGAVIDSLGWKALFYILAGVALLDIILASVLLKNVGETKKDKLDIISLLLSSIGFGGLLIGISNQGNYGWTNYLTYLPLIIGIISLIIFIIRQLKLEKPLLDIRVFKSKVFTISVILISMVYAVMSSAAILVPLYMQSMRGYSALAAGLIMLPGSVLMSVFSPISGKVLDKHGPRIVIIPGFICLFIANLAFSFLRESTPIVLVTVAYSIRMIGIAFLLMTTTTWGLNSLESKDIASGSAIGSTLRQISGSIGSAVFMAIMSSIATKNMGHMSQISANIEGMNISFLSSSVLILVGIVLAIIFVKDNKNNKALKEKVAKAS
ncbi:MDR family MFS transporter [Terrisporobacter sp.]